MGTDIERFFDRIEIYGNCWNWKLKRDQFGIAKFWLPHRQQTPERFAWIWKNGEISKRCQIIHQCENSNCVNPEHLSLGHSQKIEETFWKHVVKKEKCWEWNSARQKAGYGVFTWKRKLYSAHRVSWQLHFGKIPKGKYVCHHCDNPPCTNPSHLFVGTPLDNVLDMVKKGRHWTTKKRHI